MDSLPLNHQGSLAYPGWTLLNQVGLEKQSKTGSRRDSPADRNAANSPAVNCLGRGITWQRHEGGLWEQGLEARVRLVDLQL